MKTKATVVTYQPEYKGAFKDLNLEWIEKYFKVEKKDIHQVENPEECIATGGQIFFVVHDGEVAGTCAVYKIGDRYYEIAKMAVAPKWQGHGFGDTLMEVAEQWAREQNAREILILSNTVLKTAITLYKKHEYEVVHLGPHPDYERCNIEMRKLLSPSQRVTPNAK